MRIVLRGCKTGVETPLSGTHRRQRPGMCGSIGAARARKTAFDPLSLGFLLYIFLWGLSAITKYGRKPIDAPYTSINEPENVLEKRRSMNEHIPGVYVYGGGPVRHYVFSGEQQRRRRTRIATILLGIVFVVLLAYSARIVYGEVSQPEMATAEVVAAQQQAPAAPAQADAAAPAPAQAA